MADARRQGLVVLRATYYWIGALSAAIVFQWGWCMYLRPLGGWRDQLHQVLAQSGPPLAACLLLLPLVWWDAARFSHRLLAPLARIRGVVRQLAAGDEVPPIKVRARDEWQDFADEVNSLIVATRNNMCER